MVVHGDRCGKRLSDLHFNDFKDWASFKTPEHETLAVFNGLKVFVSAVPFLLRDFNEADGYCIECVGVAGVGGGLIDEWFHTSFMGYQLP